MNEEFENGLSYSPAYLKLVEGKNKTEVKYMAKELLKTNIERKEGFLYYCKGNPITVCEAQMARKKKK